MDIQVIENSLQAINEVYGNYIQSTNYLVNQNKVSWYNYSPGLSNKFIYTKEFEDLLNQGQYSFLFLDNSFFQFFYEFDEDGLKNAKLAYYPYPVEVREKVDDIERYLEESGLDVFETFYLGVVELKESGIVLSKNSHLRFDYDRGAKSHSTSHAHYGSINELRVPMVPVLTPFTFCDFIFYCLQVDWYSEVSSKSDYKACFDFMKSRALQTKDMIYGVHINL